MDVLDIAAPVLGGMILGVVMAFLAVTFGRYLANTQHTEDTHMPNGHHVILTDEEVTIIHTFADRESQSTAHLAAHFRKVDDNPFPRMTHDLQQLVALYITIRNKMEQQVPELRDSREAL